MSGSILLNALDSHSRPSRFQFNNIADLKFWITHLAGEGIMKISIQPILEKPRFDRSEALAVAKELCDALKPGLLSPHRGQLPAPRSSSRRHPGRSFHGHRRQLVELCRLPHRPLRQQHPNCPGSQKKRQRRRSLHLRRPTIRSALGEIMRI
jgi:hypothetical protein